MEAEIEALREIEAELRDFVAYYDQQVEYTKVRGSDQLSFAPRTIEMINTVRPVLARLDSERGKEEKSAS